VQPQVDLELTECELEGYGPFKEAQVIQPGRAPALEVIPVSFWTYIWLKLV